jgi:hypothetical protein
MKYVVNKKKREKWNAISFLLLVYQISKKGNLLFKISTQLF